MNLKTPHLTHEQLCDLLLDPSQPSAPTELSSPTEHLRDCPLCAAEFASLRDGLHNLRDATRTWASHAMLNRSWSPAPVVAAPRRLFERQLLWASAVLVFAAAIPLSLHYRQPRPQPLATAALTTQSSQNNQLGDEALLEEIDQTLSSAVPTPMQPLADPTAGQSSQTSSTRKN